MLPLTGRPLGLSPDGATLAAGVDGALQLLDTATGAVLGVRRGEPKELAWIDNGRLVARRRGGTRLLDRRGRVVAGDLPARRVHRLRRAARDGRRRPARPLLAAGHRAARAASRCSATGSTCSPPCRRARRRLACQVRSQTTEETAVGTTALKDTVGNVVVGLHRTVYRVSGGRVLGGRGRNAGTAADDDRPQERREAHVDADRAAAPQRQRASSWRRAAVTTGRPRGT